MLRFRAALCAAGALLLARASADDLACDGRAADDLTSLLQVDHLTAIRQHNHEQAAAEQGAEQFPWFPWAPPAWPANSSFVSHNGTLCFEGDQRAAEAALALRKAGIRGPLFDNVTAKPLTCKAQGFMIDGGVDPCDPGVNFFVKNISDVLTGFAMQFAVTQAYATKYGLDINTTSDMADCTCHMNSLTRQARVTAGACAKLDTITGVWLNRDPDGGPSMNCYEGPFTTATWSLAVYKASHMMLLHMHDYIEATTCAKLGYPYNNTNASTDECFPPLTMYTATADVTTDSGMDHVAFAVKVLTGAKSMTSLMLNRMGGNVQVLSAQQVFGCQCLDNSRVFTMKARGTCQAPGAMPPIRDWWKTPVER